MTSPERGVAQACATLLTVLRNNAAECIRLAEAARTSAHKSFFIEMADWWLTERVEKTQDR
jgi:hypothetical protein